MANEKRKTYHQDPQPAASSAQAETSPSAIHNLEWRDEILQVMYWMTGEGFGQAFSVADLQKFLTADEITLHKNFEQLVRDGLLEPAGDNRYGFTAQGKLEGGRRFADEFEDMMKPGHYECDDPDCDCHSPESFGEACKNILHIH